MRLFSPSKINLFLRVLRKREDGYHDLASLFQAVDLGDTIDLHFAESDSLTCSSSTLPLDRSNLIWKGVDLFRKKTALARPIRIHLEKKIPVQAGIGGGSSNAATILWGLNALHQTNISDSVLSTWAAEIGSDISFFFSLGRAFCTKRGEEVTPLSAVESPPSLWLVKPPEGLSTPKIFKLLDLSSCLPLDPEDLLKKNLSRKIFFHNDLECPAFAALPGLARLKEELVHQGFEVSMTGSGTGLLCLGPKKPEVRGAAIYPLKFLSRTPGHWYPLPSAD